MYYLFKGHFTISKYKVIKGPAYSIDDVELDSDDDLDAHMDTWYKSSFTML